MPEPAESSYTAVKTREKLYRLMISQLFFDGFQSIAVNLSQTVHAYPSCPPSDRLYNLFRLGLAQDEENQDIMVKETIAPASCLDLEFESDVNVSAPEPATYETIYVTAHKEIIRACAFSPQGHLLATGSKDASIKIMDVDRIIQRANMPQDQLLNDQIAMEAHPVIRTLYDHFDEVRCLAFHPNLQILASGGGDCLLKFFDFSKSSVKRAFRTVQEVEPIRCISYHPSGDYMLVGTQHPTLRLYDITTAQCYVACNPVDQHKGPITDVNWANTARIFCTASKDGDVKIWDGVSNRCVNTFQRAHDGAEVCGAEFSKNGKYVLTSGKDSLVKLWELSANRCLIAYTGAGATGKMEHYSKAVFNHTEDFVLFPDEKSGSLCSWDARNADRKRLLALGHTAPIRGFHHSPTQAAFVTCSDDFRARFWYKKTDME